MKIGKYTQFTTYKIWAPRWHDRKVLLAAHRVGENNKVIFIKASSMGTDPYYVSGKTVKKYGKTSNNGLACYAVPLEELEPLELINDYREVY